MVGRGLLSAKCLTATVLAAALGVTLYQRALPDIPVPAALCSALGLPKCSVDCGQVAGGLPIALMLVGRLPQILLNFRQGHAGQLAFVTYLLNVAGSGARTFTILQEVDDKLALTSGISGFVQNAILLAQIVLLGAGGAPPAATKKAGKKKA